MRALVLLVLVAACGVCRADGESCNAARHPGSAADRSWHLLTIAYSGTVTVLKGLTRHEAEFARARALGEPATVKECAAADEMAREAAAARKAQKAIEDARFRKEAPRCPPIKTSYADSYKSPPDEAAWTRWIDRHGQAGGCVNPDGTFQRWGIFEVFGDDLVPTSSAPGDIKMAEVFR